MADIAVTTANVLAGTGAVTQTVIAGALTIPGDALYRDSSDGKYKKARGNAAATAKCDGIALSTAGTNQQLVIAVPERNGNINLGATLAVGQTYCVSAAAAGAIAPLTDLTSGQYPVIIGVATTASNLLMTRLDPDVAKA